MGTVGLNFGAATSGTGFDVASTVAQILAQTQAIETPWKTQLASLATQDVALTLMGSDLSALSTSLQALTDFRGVFSQKQGSSSQPNILSLNNAGPGAVAGSHTLVVNSLAQTSSQYSSTVSNATDTLSGSFTVQVGSGPVKTITVDGASNTLASLSGAINSAAIGVTASIISDAAGSRLSLVSSVSGAGGQLTMTSSLRDATTSSALTFQTGQTGVNASLSVDGIALSSAQNIVTTAIAGVTFQLLSASPGTPVQVQIANDTGAVASAFGGFVAAYNKVHADLAAQEGKDASGNPQPLFGNSTIALLQSQLGTALSQGAASGGIAGVSQLGLEFSQTGTLTLDNSILLTALNTNFADVTGFLQNSASFGQTFSVTLNGLGRRAPNGVVYLALQQDTAQEAALHKSINDEDARIASEKKSLTAELNAANQILQSIPALLLQVNEMYSAVTGFNNTPGG